MGKILLVFFFNEDETIDLLNKEKSVQQNCTDIYKHF